MSYLHSNTAILTWPITQQGKKIAQQFAGHHRHDPLAERVRRNTLAVWVLHDFLNALGIPTDLANSDSWNPAIQLTEDVADLVIPGVGRLECRPMLSSITAVPSAVLIEERIGYVAVALDEIAAEAAFLGFVAKISLTQPQLKLGQLRSMNDLPYHLQQVRQGQTVQKSSQLTRLSQWLEGHFENGWMAAENLLAQYLLVPAFRQRVQPSQQQLIKRAKQLDLGLNIGSAKIVLLLEVEQADTAILDIAMRLYPLGETPYLPEGIDVRVIDESNTVCLTAQTRSMDDYIQLHFRGYSGEPFKVQIILGEVCMEEHFII